MNTNCSLCGNKETHVLNKCKTMLDQGRYTWRHNFVLCIIMDTLKDVSDQSWDFYCDLTGAHKFAGTTIPPDILPTQQRLDLVVINRHSKIIIIIELAVPFKHNIHQAHNHKDNKYAGLSADLQKRGYDASFVLKLVAEVYFQQMEKLARTSYPFKFTIKK